MRRPEHEELRSLHGRLGLFHEARVARLGDGPSPEAQALRSDLKAMLLSAQDGAVPRVTTGHRGGAVHPRPVRSARGAEGGSGRSAPPAPLRTLPGGWAREGQLFVAPEKEREDGARASGRGTKLVFLLDLTRLGPLRVDATVADDRVSATFRFVRAAAARLVERLLPELGAALAAAGLRPLSLSVERASEGGLATQDLRTTIPPPEAPLLDRRV